MRIPEIDCTEARTLLDGKQAVFVDIRDPYSFEQGRIPGALNLDNNNVQDFLTTTPKDATVVVCCYHGNSSLGAVSFLQNQGFEKVYSLRGGYASWSLGNESERG